jgi:hypothetical protein
VTADNKGTILSLFDYSGNWPEPFRAAGYHVVCLDVKRGMDVTKITRAWLSRNVNIMGRVVGVLAAPPCTDFSSSGAQYWKTKDLDGRTAASINLVRCALRIIDLCKPDWWALENPVGRLPKLVPELAKVRVWYFHPWEFGGWLPPGFKSNPHAGWPDQDAFSKRTGLWGNFKIPQLKPVTPQFIACSSGKSYSRINWTTRGATAYTKEVRSTTPAGFAKAFFAANS